MCMEKDEGKLGHAFVEMVEKWVRTVGEKA